MSPAIQKVAIFGASGNFGSPITAALVAAGFNLTIISRTDSSSTFPAGLRVVKTEYTTDKLKSALAGQDAAVCVVGPGGIGTQVTMIDAAEAAGVKRFIIDDFGWGPDFRGFAEFKDISAHRRVAWNHAQQRAEANPNFTYTGITTGNPIDWAMKRFPLMGFDIKDCSAIIYDAGTEQFTGTTLEGIGQSVVGVLQKPEETANRFVKVRSIQTCQNDLLEAFQCATGKQWTVHKASSKALIQSGKQKFQAGTGGWTLELAVAQLYDVGEARCIVSSKENSDSGLLNVREESLREIVSKVLG